MKKADLLNAIAENLENNGHEVTKRDIEAVLEATKEAIKDELVEGGEVTIQELGKFYVKQRAARKGRNPQTGEEIDIAAATLPAFSPAKALKEVVNF